FSELTDTWYGSAWIAFRFRSAWEGASGQGIEYRVGALEAQEEIGTPPPCGPGEESCGDRCCVLGCAHRATGVACSADQAPYIHCASDDCCVAVNWPGECGYGGSDGNLQERTCNPNGSCCPLNYEPCATGCCPTPSTTTTTSTTSTLQAATTTIPGE